MADIGFPRGVRQCSFWQFFAENSMKMKEIGPGGEGG